MTEGTGPDAVRNVVRGEVSGAMVQAGTVHGGVHLHQPTPAIKRVPRQGPTPPARFVGREAELIRLDRVWAEHGQRFGLALVTGQGGVGKSALAAQWAARAASGFPDGQLYAELGAYDTAGPARPGEVLGGFLRALGVPYDQVPLRMAEQAALFRSITADRKLLVVLDNAFSAAQVRQLLPGGAACMVVVTARSRLSGLVGDGAHILALEPLQPLAARALLRAAVGDSRVDQESGAASDLVRQCAGLPIALVVTAARLVAHPRWPIRRAAAELAGERDRLAVMSTSDDQSVAATFDLSYRALSETAARCYRVLGIHPGRRPSGDVIAAALGEPHSQVSQGLSELVEANLADDTVDGRYRMHDLTHLHAQRHAASDPDRALLAGRVAEWYLAGARAADLVLTPYRRRPSDRFMYLTPSAVAFAARDEALEWLERERTNLVATVVATAETEPEVAWRIAYGIWPLFHLRRHHNDRLIVDRAAVDCTRRVGNRDFEARMLRRLAFAHIDLGQWNEAERLYQASLAICTELDDRYGIAASIEGIGRLALSRRQFALAAECFTQELAIYQALGDRRREALATINIGVASNWSGNPAQAVPWLVRAKSLLTALVDLDPYNAARARLELGKALTGAGDYAAAAPELDEALSEMRLLGSPRGRAHAHHALALLARATGRYDAARSHLNLALDLYERLRDPAVAEVRQLVGLIPATDPHPHRMA